MLLSLLFAVALACFIITLKQATKPVPHMKDTQDPHGRGKHIDTYL